MAPMRAGVRFSGWGSRPMVGRNVRKSATAARTQMMIGRYASAGTELAMRAPAPALMMASPAAGPATAQSMGVCRE
jgi:hypothetical protein